MNRVSLMHGKAELCTCSNTLWTGSVSSSAAGLQFPLQTQQLMHQMPAVPSQKAWAEAAGTSDHMAPSLLSFCALQPGRFCPHPKADENRALGGAHSAG